MKRKKEEGSENGKERIEGEIGGGGEETGWRREEMAGREGKLKKS